MSLSAIASLLKRAAGLDEATLGAQTLARAVRQRQQRLGLNDLAAYGRRLGEDRAELNALIESVVIPETWFFREPDAFAALARLAAEWARRGVRPRLLSAPCSTGEEPYSMAVTLLEAGWAPAHFHLEAVDISRAALARAAAARYTAHSFRGANHAWRDRFAVAEGEKAFRLRPCLPESVHFRKANLVQPHTFPAGGAYHAIFCRNALIYFDAPTQRRVLEHLRRLLAPGGVLFVGAAEAFLAGQHGLRRQEEGCGFLAEAPPAPRPALAPERPASLPAPVRLPPAARPLFIAPPAPPPAPVPTLAQTRAAADAGRLEEARTLCTELLRQQPDSPEAHHLLGVLHDARGDSAQAEACYRRALYLEPRHTEALQHLALLAERAGDHAAARRLRRRVRPGAEP